MAEIDFTADEQKIDFQPEPAKTSLVGDVAKAVGRTLIGIPKGIAETFLPPESGLQEVKRTVKGLSEIIHGKPFKEVEEQYFPESRAIPSLFDPNVPREQKIETGLGVGLQVASVALPFLKGAKIKLGETVFGKRAAPVEPVPEAAVSEQASAEVQPKEVIPSATEERKVEEGVQAERPRDDTLRTPTGPSISGGVPEETGVIPQEVAPAEPKPMAPAQAQGYAEIPADGGFSDHPLIQFLRDEVGGIMSKSTALRTLGKERFEKIKSLWDSAPEFPDPRHNKIYTGGKRKLVDEEGNVTYHETGQTGATPDEAAAAAVDAGLLPQGADASTLFSEIQDISDNAHRLAKTGREARATIATGEKQYKSFTAAVAKQEKGEAPINASQLSVGDTVTVKGEPMKVTGIDPDNYDVTLEDGTRFGIQHVADNEVIYGEHEPVTAKGGETVEQKVKEDVTQRQGEGKKGRVLEPAAAEKPPAPAAGEPSLGGIKQTVAERRSAIQPGEGWTPQASIEFGRNELKKGHDPEPYFAKAESGQPLTGEEMAVARAKIETLEQATDKANDALAKDPNDPTLQANAQAADNAEAAARERLKPAQTEWGKAGAAQQFETEVDTGSIHGLRRLSQRINQRDVTPQELPGIEKQAAKVTKAKDAEAGARKTWSDEVDKLTKGTKPRSREELATHFAQRLKQLLPCKT